jgi:UDPglucose 6-dehydrogenase
MGHRMKIAVIGTGYVGLVTGTCFADRGNYVTCVDVDQSKIDLLNKGVIPIYEPGLTELVQHNQAAERLGFTTDMGAAVAPAQLVFLAVGTPQSAGGAADLSALWAAVDRIASHLRSDAIVVTKSTVPVGTTAKVAVRLKELTGRDCDVANNPEFLKEGSAIEDFMRPDRVVIGVRRPEVGNVMVQLYKPFLRTENPLLVMSPESSELTKYTANALLSTKISFINEMANLCERMGADINDVRRGIGHDSRIGFAFMFPGVGYGGACFPKDIRALAAMAKEHGLVPRLLQTVDDVNENQKRVMIHKIGDYFGGKVKGKTVAVWGLAFKPRTDDTREAPALVLVDWLLEQGATVRVHDPEALENVRAQYGDKLTYCKRLMTALDGADALAIMTEWGDYHRPDFADMRQRMRAPVVFDGRNLYDPDQMQSLGFAYHSIGRPAVG